MIVPQAALSATRAVPGLASYTRATASSRFSLSTRSSAVSWRGKKDAPSQPHAALASRNNPPLLPSFCPCPCPERGRVSAHQKAAKKDGYLGRVLGGGRRRFLLWLGHEGERERERRSPLRCAAKVFNRRDVTILRVRAAAQSYVHGEPRWSYLTNASLLVRGSMAGSHARQKRGAQTQSK